MAFLFILILAGWAGQFAQRVLPPIRVKEGMKQKVEKFRYLLVAILTVAIVIAITFDLTTWSLPNWVPPVTWLAGGYISAFIRDTRVARKAKEIYAPDTSRLAEKEVTVSKVVPAVLEEQSHLTVG